MSFTTAEKILEDFFIDEHINGIYEYICEGNVPEFDVKDIIQRNEESNIGQNIERFVYGNPKDDYNYETDIKCIPKDEVVTATCFNDLYKWTMMPVILKLEEHFKTKCPTTTEPPIIVTFGIDLRDQEMVDTINNNTDLQNQIFTNLQKMKTRKFDYDVFQYVHGKKGLDYLKDRNLLQGMFGETLIDGEVLYNGISDYSEGNITDILLKEWRHMSELNKSQVHVHMFKNTNGEFFIEATGPWHKVTWLETSIMQCVYETVLRYQLKQKKVPYLTWLGDALYRTAKSIAFTNDKPIIGALFTGRRTGGLLFLVLQNYMYSKYQTNLNAQTNSAIPKTLGSSSSDSLYILNNKLKIVTNTAPAGTHAHELSMTISALFPELDYQLPGTTQLIGHYLYWKETMKYAIGAAPIPALPDTIGTGVFLLASKLVAINDANKNDKLETSFFDKITAFRQDSGTMDHFKVLTDTFGYNKEKGKKGIMASEIEDTESIEKAIKAKYATFGAGGFYGDSAKAWIPKHIKENNTTIPDNSMAVKVRRVLNCSDEYTLLKKKINKNEIKGFSVCGDIKIDNLIQKYNDEAEEDISKFPIKTGDKISVAEACKKSSKLAIDKNMSPETQALKIALAQGYQKNALDVFDEYKFNDNSKLFNQYLNNEIEYDVYINSITPPEISHKFILNIDDFTLEEIENVGGKRRTRKNQYIKETRRKRNKNCSMKKPKSKKPKTRRRIARKM